MWKMGWFQTMLCLLLVMVFCTGFASHCARLRLYWYNYNY